MNRKNRARRAAAMIATLGILVEPSAHLIARRHGAGSAAPAPQTTTAKPQATAPAGKTRRPPPPPRSRHWRPSPPPRRRRSTAGGRGSTTCPSGGSILVYQPQISTWDKQTHLVAFSAVSLRNKAGDKPALGTIKLEADTKVAVADRLVSFQNMKITEVNFQTLPKEQVREIVDGHRKSDSRRRTGDRARSRPRQHRQEQHRAEDGRRHQVRSRRRSSSARARP